MIGEQKTWSVPQFTPQFPELTRYAKEQIAAQTASIAPPPAPPPTPTPRANSLKDQLSANLDAAAGKAPTPQQIANLKAQAEREREEENDFGHDM